jgi:6-phosphogluconolactonase
MQLEVYQTDAEVYEAAAAHVAERLAVAARRGNAAVVLPGGRGGRPFMLALAARGEVPWARVDVFFTDECWLPDADPRRTWHVARESLLAPRAVPADRVHPIVVGAHDAASAAATYRALLAGQPALDVVVLELGAAGEIAAVAPGSAAARSTETVVAVDPADVVVEPRVPRVTLTTAGLRAARHVVLTATGATRAAALAAALREPIDVVRRPAQAVLPSPTAAWFVDRAAAEPLLRDARPAPPGAGRGPACQPED